MSAEDPAPDGAKIIDFNAGTMPFRYQHRVRECWFNKPANQLRRVFDEFGFFDQHGFDLEPRYNTDTRMRFSQSKEGGYFICDVELSTGQGLVISMNMGNATVKNRSLLNYYSFQQFAFNGEDMMERLYTLHRVGMLAASKAFPGAVDATLNALRLGLRLTPFTDVDPKQLITMITDDT